MLISLITIDTLFSIKEEKQRLSFLIKDLRIEHIGSTSVPMLWGKDMIDIAWAIAT
ncbi:MAG: GrpB family protein [Parachlamydiaceae bacterium]